MVAGPLVREVIYTRANAREPAKVRQAKRKTSSEAQQRMNARNSWEKLELMLAANFTTGDLFATLTFDDQHLPATRTAAAARLKQFRKDFTLLRAAKHEDARMIWTLENAHDGRWHVHIVVNATGDDFSDILRCWPYGSDVEIRKIQVDREKNYESLARYMCKEMRERPGLRSWSYTRNCQHPEIETFAVPDDTVLKVPEDATVLSEEQKRTEYAEFHYIKYLSKSLRQLRSPRRRARRKR